MIYVTRSSDSWRSTVQDDERDGVDGVDLVHIAQKAKVRELDGLKY